MSYQTTPLLQYLGGPLVKDLCSRVSLGVFCFLCSCYTHTIRSHVNAKSPANYYVNKKCFKCLYSGAKNIKSATGCTSSPA